MGRVLELLWRRTKVQCVVILNARFRNRALSENVSANRMWHENHKAHVFRAFIPSGTDTSLRTVHQYRDAGLQENPTQADDVLVRAEAPTERLLQFCRHACIGVFVPGATCIADSTENYACIFPSFRRLTTCLNWYS